MGSVNSPQATLTVAARAPQVTIDPQLLSYLVCPACHGELESVGANDDAPGLECQKCGRVYPIRDGIPVMLVEEATPPTREVATDSKPEEGDS